MLQVLCPCTVSCQDSISRIDCTYHFDGSVYHLILPREEPVFFQANQSQLNIVLKSQQSKITLKATLHIPLSCYASDLNSKRLN
jgi:hypothetical protein